MTVNEQLQDDAIRHAIGLNRLRAGALRRITRLLEDADADLAAQIMARLADLSGNDIATITTSGTFSTERLRRLRASIQRLERFAREAYEESFNSEISGIASMEQDFWEERINRALPSELRLTVNTVAASTVEAAALSRPLQGRVLSTIAREWGADRRRRVDQAVRIGFVNGETINQIARRVTDQLEVSRSVARRDVRTAVTHMASFARRRVAEANPDLIRNELWVSTLDGRTSPICIGNDGKVLTDRSLNPAPGSRPPVHWNCRSVTSFVLSSWRELGFDIEDLTAETRASMNGQVPRAVRFPDFFNDQSEEFQRELLGPTKFELFQSGEFEITDFIDNSGMFFTVDELRRREPDFFRDAA